MSLYRLITIAIFLFHTIPPSSSSSRLLLRHTGFFFVIPASSSSYRLFPLVIPAKAGIQFCAYRAKLVSFLPLVIPPKGGTQLAPPVPTCVIRHYYASLRSANWIPASAGMTPGCGIPPLQFNLN